MPSVLRKQILLFFLVCGGYLNFTLVIAQASSYEKARKEVDSLRRLSEQELPPAQALHVTLELIGYYIDFSQQDSVQLYIDEGMRLNEIVQDSLKGFFLTAYQTEVFLYSTLYEQGIQYAMKGLQQAEHLKDREFIANQYNLLGLLYAEMAQYQQAMGFFELSLTYLPPQSKHHYGLTRRYHVLSNIAQCYEILKDIPAAIRYNLSSLKEAQRQEGFRGMSVASWSLGNIFYTQGNYVQALHYYQQSLHYSEIIHDTDAAIAVYPHLFHVHSKLNDPLTANKFLNQGLAIAQKDIQRIKPSSLKEFYTEVIQIYYQLFNYRNVVTYQQKLNKISEQIIHQEKKQRLAVLAAFYENEKRIAQIVLEKKEQEAQLKQHQLFLRYMALLIGLVIITFCAFYYAFRQKQRLKSWQFQQQIKTLNQKQEMAALRAMVEGEEQERVRIARELHDGLTGLLSAARHQVESTFRQLPLSEDKICLTSPAIQLLDKAFHEVRRISHNLMPYALQRHGLATALQEYCENVQQSGLLKIEYQQLGWRERLSPTLELWLYRIIQELISNSLKHAKATQALVQLCRFEEIIQITVEDNGQGFDTHKVNTKDGNGLLNIESRIKYMNGNLSVKSDGQGTSTHIELSLVYIPHEL
ncbi:tetratricopeptide repeat-containing sensor histidine kinase [Xanthocytophaga agilis]|uniref:histidine kinase n=1 Tax=Xanthocytophaga agilis TaxID=3048010 RepID=A0AAE3QYA4_9BACT|nr:ATP-binding protein [Xanthocytophaga agilis]MDJ1500264.1 histidine kinase [Xanthocytophaga agilis]